MPQVTEEQFHSNGPWECFHCGEVFTTPGAAADHFGAQDATPGCLIEYRVALEEGGKPERGRGLQMALRKAEERIAALERMLDETENNSTNAQIELSNLKRKIGELLQRPGRTVEQLVELFHATTPEHGGFVFNCEHWPCTWLHGPHQFTETLEEVEDRLKGLCIVCGHLEGHPVHRAAL